MKLAMFSDNGRPALGVVQGDRLQPVWAGERDAPSLFDVLQGGPAMLAEVRARAEKPQTASLPLADVDLLAPLPQSRKFLGIGLNYMDHLEEAGAAGPHDAQTQMWFNKQVTCIVGPHDPIQLPRVSSQLDYEAELAVVIGARCRHVRVEDAMSVVAGFMVCNDVSVRDWQSASPTATLGKSFDTHGPTGPWLTTIDEIANPYDLRIRTWVDDHQVQDGNTAQMILRIDAMIAHLTEVFTLEPGDILATGTPGGVGVTQKPPRFLKAGQTVRIAINGLGEIANLVVDEPDGRFHP